MPPTIDRDNDKNTVISLREIAEEKIKVSDLTESAVYKLRKHVEQVDDGVEDDETAAPEVDAAVGQETMNEQGEVSLDEVSESENQEADVASEDPEASNS